MLRTLVAGLVLTAVLAGCGGSGGMEERPSAAEDGGTEGEQAPSAAAPDGPDPVHIHGLGVDPEDGALLIATHNGLFRLGPADSRPRLLGEGLHDLMGFTVVAPRHFLASGHPDVRGMQEQGLPPHLGLIESRDGGETWQNVSLLGEADFHVLRAAGDRVYGFDSTHGRLLASEDRGATWTERMTPGVLLDLAVAPDDPDRLVAAGEQGLLESRDAGRSWKRVGKAVGLLGWPEGGPLHLVDGRGSVFSSADARAWKPAGDVGGQPAALLAAGPRELYVALHGGAITYSADGGESWTVLSAPTGP